MQVNAVHLEGHLLHEHIAIYQSLLPSPHEFGIEWKCTTMRHFFVSIRILVICWEDWISEFFFHFVKVICIIELDYGSVKMAVQLALYLGLDVK